MITILFSTRDGQETLPEVLGSYEQLFPPDSGWKVVVVDNGSEDKTPGILEEFRDRLPLEIIREDRPGKNLALNRGLDYTEGELVVLTDDDAIPAPNWLVAWERITRREKKYALFAGKIDPLWKTEIPHWLRKTAIFDTELLSAAYAVTPKTLEEGEIDAGMVWGPNMAIRMDVFNRGYRFDESIGPRPGHYPMGSETEFTRRLKKEGYKAWYCPDVTVSHIIFPVQVTEKWLLQRAIKAGRGQYRKDLDNNKNIRTLAGAPRYLWRLLLFYVIQGLIEKLKCKRSKKFENFWKANFFWGKIMEARFLGK